MASDRYCAICAGPIFTLSPEEERGSSSKYAKRIRRRVIAAGRYERYNEGNEDGFKKRPREGGDDERARLEDEQSGTEEWFEIEHAYDPAILSGHDTSWLPLVVFLVHDPDMKTVSKCFISDLGRFEDENWAQASGHPERPHETLELILYESYGVNESVSFPCHLTCLQIFARSVTGTPDVTGLDPDLLYEVMDHDIGSGGSVLRLDYGDRGEPDQYWECNTGEEYCVIDPLEPSVLDGAAVQALLLKRFLKLESCRKLPIKHTTTDPFRKLSTELITCVTDFLSGHDVLRLSQASMTVFKTTDDHGFWRRLVTRELGWLWEVLQDLGARHGDIDWKSFYMLADHVTNRPWGMRGQYTSLANRRRIWHACSQLAVHYRRRRPTTRSAEDDFRDNAISLHIPAISNPEPTASSPFCTTIASWDARASSINLSLAWNSKDELAGIALHRLSDESYARVMTVEIGPGDCLQSLTLFMKPIDILELYEPPTAVLGVRVLMSSGIVHDLGDTSARYNQRYVAASEGRELIGFKGRTDDVLHRVHALGGLEAYRYTFASPDETGSGNAAMPQTFRFLWAPDSVLLPGEITGYVEDQMHEIWRHPTIVMEPPDGANFENRDLTKDLIPMEAIVYDKRDVTGIEVMVVPDGRTSDTHGAVVHRETAIVGIRMCLARGCMQQWSTVGSLPGPEYNKHMGEHVHGWDSHDYVQRFNIDGPGGESLDLVAAEINYGLKAIRFRTNRQREMVFGSGSGRNDWYTQDFSSATSPCMTGFVCGFATISGLVGAMGMTGTLLRLTCITALTVKR